MHHGPLTRQQPSTYLQELAGGLRASFSSHVAPDSLARLYELAKVEMPYNGNFACLRNSTDYRHVGVVDIRIKDGTLVMQNDPHSDALVSSKPEKPGSHPHGIARIYLCPHDDLIDALENYLEFGTGGPADGIEPQKDPDPVVRLNESGNCPYDLRDLSQWTSRREPKPLWHANDAEKAETPTKMIEDGPGSKNLDESDAEYTFTELLSVPGSRGEESAYGKLVQHKIYLFVHSANKLTIVWRCCNKNVDDSACQQAFVKSVPGGKSVFNLTHEEQFSRDEFVALFLMKLLALDIDQFERAVQDEIRPKLTTDLIATADSVMTDYAKAMEGRIYNFNRVKCMIEKAEDIYETCTYLDQNLEFNDDKTLAAAVHDKMRLEGLRCSSLVKHTKRLDTRYQDLFALNTTVSQARQSSSVTILTVLAAVFLPLSLASAVLSMQYRFHELGPRLYDFFGVAWVFCTFALICFVLVRYGNRALDKFWSLKHLQKSDYVTWRGSIRGITYSYIVGWMLVLASFLMGMFLKEQDVDWRAYPLLALGFTIFITAPFVVPVLDIMITIVCLFGNCCSFTRPKWSKRGVRDRKLKKGRKNPASDSGAGEV